ncbi:uncharacterized protein LOC108105954 [Drosophila eugracilis]|uniref:uncharacterized protein LOC108105954 n=1 Tax=Drosophila eugracilis TaxID=29029 RepID=UPI0007E65E5C|nr:uncharacterized protein LOC108105954 [Drosophila eugracilis]
MKFMSYYFIHFFLTLVDVLLATNADTNNATMIPSNNIFDISKGKCVDCREESKELCRIEEEGYSCYDGEFHRQKPDELNEFPETTTNTEVCIPPGMVIENLHAKICCVWSPRKGCQILLYEEHQGEFCFTCRVKYKMEYKNLKPCPCITNKGLSNEVYGKSLHIFIFIYFSWHIVCLILTN